MRGRAVLSHPTLGSRHHHACSVSSRRIRQNAPAQLAWGAAKRGIRARTVKSAYSSQECHRCHYAARENRSTQQTFCCEVCGHTHHADVNAAENLASRLGDQELAACRDRLAIKALLDRRHQAWKVKNGWP